MPNDLLKEAHTPLFEDNTSYRDPLKELEEYLAEEEELNKGSLSLLKRPMTEEGKSLATYTRGKRDLAKRVLAKIAEMRENKDV